MSVLQFDDATSFSADHKDAKDAVEDNDKRKGEGRGGAGSQQVY